MLRFLKQFLKLEAASGLLLMLVALLAMLLANSPIASTYQAFLSLPMGMDVGGYDFHRPVDWWINDGLMTIFFLLVGLEIKRELMIGELSQRSKAALPFIAAAGGVITPALIFSYYNWGSDAMRGWAIPTATDIAFSLGVLSLFGQRVPLSMKIFLMAIAVIDDLIAVLIIAFFYTQHIAFGPLFIAGCAGSLLLGCNRLGIHRTWPFVLGGIVLWAAIYASGIHPTVAGVALGMLVPLPMGRRFIHSLHPWVAFGIVPIFALANAGVPLAGVTPERLLEPLPLGIAAGLFIGKQIGIFGASWLAVRWRVAALPEGMSLSRLYAVAVIAGIGFTMSLFIGSLAFDDTTTLVNVRLGVIIGSLFSVLFGYMLMLFVVRGRNS